ncbi:hypothetical protein OG875_13815 [Streptomyces sp. NBC_01498]|uniref:hypothetical protein n=1 Tax=Streptomyces sp. NBC_01498 TaxID=2975870 RepID=UPI002E7B824D|nr:hypothetical protein [Streptomyces sp. NBC_01498]WTL25577.1 hypothetical protein OG875_13815 [Streptomyces sp. NBC_01498]
MNATENREPPAVGTLLHDTERDKVGEFRGAVGGVWHLRPPGGGKEWEVAPRNVMPAGPYELLRAATAEDNATRRAYRL